MPRRFVNIDHDTPMLLPPDLRGWVPKDHLVHFIMDAVALLDLSKARLNERGTGNAQYPPGMMLGLIIYCYATGTFASRRIEKLSHENVAVRYLCADTHPDHDSICKFRRENQELIASAFHQVLEMAASANVLKVGELTVAIDGTKILANASKHSAMSHGHLEKQMTLASEQIAQLLAKAEEADSTPLQDGLSIPEEIQRREDRLTKLKQAKEAMEQRAQARFEEELATYEDKVQKRQAKAESRGGKPRGKSSKPPEPGARPQDQYNFTDPESRIMKVRGGFEQSYNAQAAVEVETMLIVGGHVSHAANDKRQLIPTLQAISPVVGTIANVLVDNGYSSAPAISEIESSNPCLKIYAANGRQSHGRSIEQLEEQPDAPAPEAGSSVMEFMAHRLATKAGKELYGLRKQTVEPAFGIIKEALGFRRFLLRGLSKVNLEWELVRLSYNLKRLFILKPSLGIA